MSIGDCPHWPDCGHKAMGECDAYGANDERCAKTHAEQKLVQHAINTQKLSASPTTQAQAREAVEQITKALEGKWGFRPTPGPWFGDFDGVYEGVDRASRTGTICRSMSTRGKTEAEEGNNVFIAACNPENIRSVLALLSAKQEELDKMRADAERYRFLRARIGGRTDDFGVKQFELKSIRPLDNPMKGSVAQHLDEAVDAARAALSPIQGAAHE